MDFQKIFERFSQHKWTEFKRDPDKENIQCEMPDLPEELTEWILKVKGSSPDIYPEDLEKFTTKKPSMKLKIPLKDVYSMTYELKPRKKSFKFLFDWVEKTDMASDTIRYKEPIKFLYFDDKYYFGDGHHRVATALALGKEFINGIIYDLNDVIKGRDEHE